MFTAHPFSSRHVQAATGKPSRWTFARLVLGTLAMAATTTAFAKFGDTEEIQGNSPIPSGWVVTHVSAPGLGGMGRGFQALPSKDQFVFTIMHVAGAEKGTELDVRGNSPIPEGWVIRKTVWPSGMSKGKMPSQPDWATVHTIKCLIEKPAPPIAPN